MTTAWEETARRPRPGRLTGEEVVLEFGMTANNQRRSRRLSSRRPGCQLGAWVNLSRLSLGKAKNSEECATTQRTASGPGITGAKYGDRGLKEKQLGGEIQQSGSGRIRRSAVAVVSDPFLGKNAMILIMDYGPELVRDAG